MEKHYCNPQYFQEKLNYKAKFSTSLILKKNRQIILKKIIKKTKGKKSCRETQQQFIVFCEKIYNCNSQPT
jgi:hypothetical protein